MVIREVFYGTQAIAAVYKGTELIWDHGCSIKAVMAVDADLRGHVVSIRIAPVIGSVFADAGADAMAESIPGVSLSGSGAVMAGVDGIAHSFALSAMKGGSGADVDAAAGVTVRNLLPLDAQLPAEVGSYERVTGGTSAAAAVGSTGLDMGADVKMFTPAAKSVESQALVKAQAEPEVTGGTGGILNFGENAPALDAGSAQEITGGIAGVVSSGEAGASAEVDHRVTGGNAGVLKPGSTGVDAKADHRVTGGNAGNVTPGSTGVDAKADHRVTGGNAGNVTPGSTGVDAKADHRVTGGIAGKVTPGSAGVDVKADHYVTGGMAGDLKPGRTGVDAAARAEAAAGNAGRIRQDGDVDAYADSSIATPESMPVTGSMGARVGVSGSFYTPAPVPLDGEMWLEPDGTAHFSMLPPIPITGQIPADADGSAGIDAIQTAAVSEDAGVAMEIHAILTVLPIEAVAGELCVDADAAASVDDSSKDWLYPVEENGILRIKQAIKIIKGD